jgi:hypothetical protein
MVPPTADEPAAVLLPPWPAVLASPEVPAIVAAPALPPGLAPVNAASSEPQARGTTAASATATNHFKFLIGFS